MTNDQLRKVAEAVAKVADEMGVAVAIAVCLRDQGAEHPHVIVNYRPTVEMPLLAEQLWAVVEPSLPAGVWDAGKMN